MATLTDIQKKLIADFDLHTKDELRLSSMRQFERLGFPTTKNEEWKYTNLAPVLSSPLLVSETGSFVVTRESLKSNLSLDNDCIIVVIENGRFNKAASSIDDAVIDIKSIMGNHVSPESEKYFSYLADTVTDAFSALNTALCPEALCIHIKPDVRVEKPIIVIHISTATDAVILNNSRLLVVAEKNAHTKVSCISLSANKSASSFLNSVNEIIVEDNASIEFNLIQNENTLSNQICNTYVCQLKDSKFTINTVTLGGNLTRNKLHIKLDAENCETHLYGFYFATGNQLIDNHTAVVHAKPHCNSNQLYKGLVGDTAHGVFNGKIVVERDAQKTNAFQSNKNILLSNNAVINAKPQLEIFADDVKCTHGATTGQMDEEALFYLRARGINLTVAKALLNQAFVADVLNNITVSDIYDYASRETEKKLLDTHSS